MCLRVDAWWCGRGAKPPRTRALLVCLRNGGRASSLRTNLRAATEQSAGATKSGTVRERSSPA
eukprot:9057792-Prorocentrum_lima.AAC.1